MTIERRMGAAFIGALAVLVGLTLVSLLNLRSLHASMRRVAGSRDILARVENILAQVRDVESCQRGFVINGDEDALRRQGGCRADASPSLTALRDLAAAKPAQLVRLGRLEPLVGQNLDFAQKAIAIRRKEGFAAAGRLIGRDRRGRTMTDLRRVAAEMIAEEASFLRLWLEEREAGLERTFQLMALGGTFSVLILAAAGWRLRHDLRERRRLERELDDFFSMSVDLLCIADLSGRFTRLSPSWQKALGWSAADLKSKPFLDFVHPEDRARTEAESSRLARGTTTVDFENRYLCRDGSYRWLSWCAAGDLESGLLLAVARDATSHKEAERLREELTHHVNHDLRAPAATIEMAAQSLLSGDAGAAPEPMRPLLEAVSRNAAHLCRMIADLLDITRSATGKLALKPESVDLGAIVRETVADFAPAAAGKGVALAASLPPRLEGAHADPVRLRQILTNLVDNAMKFTPAGGRIEVRAASEQEGFLEVSVSDTGRGIPAAHHAALFNRHFQVPGTKELGLGLGLAICRDLVTRQGGRIWFESEEGRGTTFHFTVRTAEGV